jgi:uncharacterized damage-inducible protein DinB
MTNKDFFISTWQRESGVTAKAFRSLPNDIAKLNTKHHPKFRSPWEIVNHIGPHAKELYQGVIEGKIDLVNEGQFDLKGPSIYKDPESGAKSLEEYTTKFIDALKKVDENTWATRQVPAYWGTRKIMELPLMQVCWMMLFDTIHHRGQLTSYYRLVGAPQPDLYGPTAEMEEAMMSKSN